jgi:hypothetical protein
MVSSSFFLLFTLIDPLINQHIRRCGEALISVVASAAVATAGTPEWYAVDPRSGTNLRLGHFGCYGLRVDTGPATACS